MNDRICVSGPVPLRGQSVSSCEDSLRLSSGAQNEIPSSDARYVAVAQTPSHVRDAQSQFPERPDRCRSKGSDVLGGSSQTG